MKPADRKLLQQTQEKANGESGIAASDGLTGEGGHVEQFVFSNVGEQRQRGMILHHMAALADITSPTLDSQRKVIVRASFHHGD